MSYCVNCGVELGNTEKLCPLCFEKVDNPLEKSENGANSDLMPNYPNVPVGGMKMDFRDLVLPITLILGIPVLISLICDYLIGGGLTWSKFVALSIALAYIYMIPPLAFKRRWMVFYMLLDCVGTILFLYILNILTDGEWFFSAALPISLIFSAIFVGIGSLFNYVDMRKLVRFSIGLFSVAACSVGVDYFTRAKEGILPVGWSLIVAIPCVILGVVSLIVNHNKRLKEQLRQRFFV